MTVYNASGQALTVQLYKEGTTDPIVGAQFLLTAATGAKLGDENGVFTTDSNGRFVLPELKPGLTVKIQQTSTAEGFLIDGEAKTITIKSGNTQTVTVYNAPTQALNVQLYAQGTTDPIAGAQFLLTDSSGKKLGTENGVFTTDSNGRFTLSGLKPGLTVKIQQTSTADGFLIDSDAKTIAIESGDAQTVTVYNAPKQSLTVQLYVKDSTTTIVGGRFLVTDGTGAKLGSEDGVFTTDENGRFSLRGLVPGTTVKLKQTATADGYLIDGEAKTITVKSGEAQTVTVYNAPTQALTVKLYVTGTTTPIEGAKFLVRDSGGKVIGESNGMYTTDHNGEFTIHGLTPGVSIRATQTDTISGYVLSGGTQSILIKSGAAQSMTFYNPVSGSLTIQSLDSLTNAPIPGTEFKVLYADGRPVDNTNGQESSGGQYFTDTNGEIHITGIVGTVVVTGYYSQPRKEGRVSSDPALKWVWAKSRDLFSSAVAQDFINGKRVSTEQTRQCGHLIKTIASARFDVTPYRCVITGVLFTLKLSGYLHVGFRISQAPFAQIICDRQVKTCYPRKIIVLIVQKTPNQRIFFLVKGIVRVFVMFCVRLYDNLIKPDEEFLYIRSLKSLLPAFKRFFSVVNGGLDMFLHILCPLPPAAVRRLLQITQQMRTALDVLKTIIIVIVYFIVVVHYFGGLWKVGQYAVLINSGLVLMLVRKIQRQTLIAVKPEAGPLLVYENDRIVPIYYRKKQYLHFQVQHEKTQILRRPALQFRNITVRWIYFPLGKPANNPSSLANGYISDIDERQSQSLCILPILVLFLQIIRHGLTEALPAFDTHIVRKIMPPFDHDNLVIQFIFMDFRSNLPKFPAAYRAAFITVDFCLRHLMILEAFQLRLRVSMLSATFLSCLLTRIGNDLLFI